MDEKIKPKFNISVKLIVLLSLIAIIGVLSTIILMKEEKKPEIVTQAELQDIINVSDLSTYEAIYNGVAKVMNETENTEVDYYVSYEAKVKAGLDFEEINIAVDHDKKNITVDLPEIKITEVIVDIASLDYIFENPRTNVSTVSEQAYKKCIEDVTQEASVEEAIYVLAGENARNIIKALIQPFIEQLDADYILILN